MIIGSMLKRRFMGVFTIMCPIRTLGQAFVSEYAVTGSDAGKGSLLSALAEGAFLIGLELNRFAISYFVLCFFMNLF